MDAEEKAQSIFKTILYLKSTEKVWAKKAWKFITNLHFLMTFDTYFRKLIKIINRVQKTFHSKLHGIIKGINIKVCPQRKNAILRKWYL